MYQTESLKWKKMDKNTQNNSKLTKMRQNKSKVTKIERTQLHKLNQN